MYDTPSISYCGGVTYKGPTECGSGLVCKEWNPYYHQCIPGKPTSTLKTSTTLAPTSSTSTTMQTSSSPSSSSTSTSTSSAAPTATGPDTATKARGRVYFGTATDRDTLSDPEYEAIVKSEYGQVTPENSMKWESTKGTFTMSDADFLVDWAVTNGKLTRGHTLGTLNPPISFSRPVSAITDPAELTSVIENHIENDVVNEVFNDDGTWGSSVFYNVLGEPFVGIAFRAARKADPTAKLYINDYNLDYSGPKVDATVALANRLIADGIPIDGIGSQAHLVLNNGAIPNMHQPLQALASTGLEVALTELDIRMDTPSDAQRLADQVTNFNQASHACIRIPACVGITSWGVSDKYSWVPGTFEGQGAALI
ncbi:hypothetical protein L873DRAFT_1828918 [Choiromyces venosus 120613-1]|uniref:Beta-xylanase n=1 Tax=Choiromyces venosus 120613-1 TaxID=1336337 RepID=A0A3N4JMP5_9PEZI|nr:hypothetical protein L873DRAFT_1828918 [Choiromyces venosus 120613-1]